MLLMWVVVEGLLSLVLLVLLMLWMKILVLFFWVLILSVGLIWESLCIEVMLMCERLFWLYVLVELV